MIQSKHGKSESEKAGQSARKPAQAAGNGRRQGRAIRTKETSALTNPHGANQYVTDPRSALFIAYYLDPKSQSFSNAYKSALLAGFEETYARNILNLMPAWLSDKLDEYRASSLLSKAERNIEKYLDMPTRVPAMGAFGPILAKVERKKTVKLKNGRKVERKIIEKVPVFVESGKLLEIQQKSSHFVAERIGKKMYGKESDETPPAASIVNMTQIIINPPAKTV